jgi:very-short-patch-repair endonuclease
MNEIEELFFYSYIDLGFNSMFLESQKPIGIYRVDFLFKKTLVVEIDGHESHKTKEQRYEDYTRERFFLKKGYAVLRFMASEIFVDPESCVKEMIQVFKGSNNPNVDSFDESFNLGYELGKYESEGK